MSWIFWELLFSMLCMVRTDKGSSINLDLMLYGNYVMIMTMLKFLYVCMYVCMYVVVCQDDDCFILNVYVYVSMYICHCLIGSSGIILVKE